MRTLSLDEAAHVLKLSPRTLGDRRFRMRVGLAARKVGRRLVFMESELERLLRAGRERCGPAPRRDGHGAGARRVAVGAGGR